MLAQRECIVELTGVAEVQGTRSSVRAGTRGEEGECVGCGEDHVLEEEDPIEVVGGVCDGGVFGVLEDEAAQSCELRDSPQLPFPLRGIVESPGLIHPLGRAISSACVVSSRITVRCTPKLPERFVECAKPRFGIVPRPGLVQTEVDILHAQVLDERQDRDRLYG